MGVRAEPLVPGAAAGHPGGRELLQAELDLEPIFTPHWNRCTAETGEALAELGFRVLSRASRAEPLGVDGPREIPVHVDFARLSPEEAGRRPAQAIAAGGRLGVMFDHAEMGDEELERAYELLRLPFTARLITELA